MNNADWQKFASGKWQKEMPQQEGNFPIANRDGVIFPVPKNIRNIDGIFYPRSPWHGWWWSEPMPELPCPPEW